VLPAKSGIGKEKYVTPFQCGNLWESGHLENWCGDGRILLRKGYM
jgi:hypothetical protein